MKLFTNIKNKFHPVNLAAIVTQMFDEMGVKPECPEENVFLTSIDGAYCRFITMLRCTDDNRLLIFVRFPIPVPEHVTAATALELVRLNGINRHKSGTIVQENDNLFAVNEFKFDEVPTTGEIKNLILSTIDLINDDNFRSLICAVMGFETYDELEKVMTSNATVNGDEAKIQMQDGYHALDDKSDGISSSRYAGRLLMLAIAIIDKRISQETARRLLDEQTALPSIVQKAYDAADYIERDILRKLIYLVLDKEENYHDDGGDDSILGRLEAMSMIEKDKHSLLYGVSQEPSETNQLI